MKTTVRITITFLAAILAIGSCAAGAGAAGSLTLERIEVTGNRRLGAGEIISSLDLSPGDTLDTTLLESKRIALLESRDILSEVSFFTRPGSARGSVILEIDVVEKKVITIETGYGYHDLHGWFLTLAGVKFDNPFDTDSSLRLGFRLGFNLAGLDADWTGRISPLWGIGWGFRGFIYTEDHSFFSAGGLPEAGEAEEGDVDEADWSEFKQKIHRSGAELSLRYRSGESRLSFGLRAEAVEPDSTFEDVEADSEKPFTDFPEVMRPWIDRTVMTGLFLRMVRDTRDHPFYPRSGSFTLLSIEANNTLIGGDETFTRVTCDARKFFDLGNYRVASMRFKSGAVSYGAPYFERYFIGGIYSIRGFKELSLSPTEGDDAYWMASGEYRFPLISSIDDPPRLTGLVFFDAGQGWRRGTPLSISDIESAAGYGFRLRLPWLGTFGIDAAVPFSRGRTGDKFRIHGSLGFSF